ncbi:hypothetical protein CRENBAI_008126 [Crenichthys baileyi]|uniref:Uncharacterized protein n=1 Tax=Crenichthys baileyi TaxID=28760 RepID=A0AAV9R517_9TELE
MKTNNNGRRTLTHTPSPDPDPLPRPQSPTIPIFIRRGGHDTDIEHMLPNPNAMNPRPPQCIGTLPQESFIPEKPTEHHPHSGSSTHSPAPSNPTASCPHHTARHDSKARAPCNATPAPAHRRNRADTVEHLASIRTPNPTPR